MRIDALTLTGFRNFAAAAFEPIDGVNVFYGDNGAGKTNLLEAIFTLCLGRSQRGARDIMMIGPGEVFRLEGLGSLGDRSSSNRVKITCAYQRGGRKKITVDDNPARISRLYRLFKLISMAPEDVSLFSGSPGDRRRFLDLHLAQASPSYLADLTDYNKALAQKNSFLKNGGDEECPFDPLLVQLGAKLMTARHHFIVALEAAAPGYYADIAGDGDGVTHPFAMSYTPNVRFEAIDDIPRLFEEKLVARRRKEQILETAVVGPHRDDVNFVIGEFPAKGYGSMGEQRTAAVATKMAAADFLQERTGETPILLLDEIFAELDRRRRENLARLFLRFDQIFLTTAIEPPENLLTEARIYTIVNGRIEDD